jgi:hypothetical protein
MLEGVATIRAGQAVLVDFQNFKDLRVDRSI